MGKGKKERAKASKAKKSGMSEEARKKAQEERMQRELLQRKMDEWQKRCDAKEELEILSPLFPDLTFKNISRIFNIKTMDEYLYGHKEDPSVHFFINGLMTEWFFTQFKLDECKYIFIHKGQLLPVDEIRDDQLKGFLNFAKATCLHCDKPDKSFVTNCGKYLCKKCIFKGCPCGCLPEHPADKVAVPIEDTPKQAWQKNEKVVDC